MNIQDFGFFVRIIDINRNVREGLVHIGQIRQGHRLEKASDSGCQIKDDVYVKLIQIRDDGKLSLSMKEVDQHNG